jgi:bleomycin hydrolase
LGGSQTPTLKLSQLILTNADPKTSLISRERIIQDQPVFNLELKGVPDKDGKNRKGVYPGPVTNQKASGRCWLFATSKWWSVLRVSLGQYLILLSLFCSANCLRYRVIPQLNLGDFQLSQSYLFFYDKLE